MKHRCVEIVHVDFIFDRLEPKFVGGTVNITTFDATTRKPHREAIVIVITATCRTCIRARLRKFHGWRSPEFAAPNDERTIEKPTLFEIFQQCTDSLGAFTCQLTMVLFDLIVTVPRLSVAMP